MVIDLFHFKAKKLLKLLREDRQTLLASGFAPIEQDENGFIWWTWAGGNINHTLRSVFKIELNADAQANNECVKVKIGHAAIDAYGNIMEKISDPQYWNQPDLFKKLSAMVPNYRLSKFQPYLPKELKSRLVAETIYDIEGTLSFLKRAAFSPARHIARCY